MEFSESFHFGNTTFLNIESQVKHAIKEEPPSENNAEIIQESPTEHKSVKNASKRLSMHAWNRSRKFRRSKSDSTLQSPQLKRTNVDNYSEFFCSEFTYSLKEKEVSMVNVSEIETALAEEEEGEERMEKHIFSEDINELLANSSAIECKEIEEKSILDASAFMEPATDAATREHLDEMLEKSRIELLELHNEQTKIKNISFNKTKLVENNCNKSKNYTLTIKTNSSLLSSNLEQLKSISAWNLPACVQAVYEQKGVRQMFDWQVECLSNPKVKI